MNEIKNVELFAVGIWNGHRVTKAMLKDIADAYTKFATNLRIPLKFGHNDDQDMTDGKPALGWVSNVRVEDNKLLGDFSDVPDIVYKAIKQKMYNSLSIELDVDVDYKGNNYPAVLTGVALLGADLPAVNTIKDLGHYLGDDKSGLKASRAIAFSYKPSDKFKESEMDELEKAQAEIKKLQARNDALETSHGDLVKENVKFKAERDSLQAKIDASKKVEEELAFTTAKDEVVKSMDDLVKSGTITPAQRDKFTASIKDGDIASIETVKFTVDTLSDGAKKFSRNEDEQGKNRSRDDKNDDELPADTRLFAKIQKHRAEHGSDFTTAKSVVLASDPDLARDYIELTQEV